MAKVVTIYHNPRCSKSRQTLELLESRGIEPEIVKYLETPPNQKQIRELIRMLGVEPHDILRSKEPAYSEHGLSKQSSSRDIIQAISESPVLLERPIVVAGKKAKIGRPPENVLSIL